MYFINHRPLVYFELLIPPLQRWPPLRLLMLAGLSLTAREMAAPLNVMAWIFFLAAVHVFLVPGSGAIVLPTGRECPRTMASELNCGTTFGFMKTPACCQDTLISYMDKGFCVDLDNDLDFCGSCSQRCTEYEDCCNGKCTVVYNDNLNCGTCGARCQEHQICKTFVTLEDLDHNGFPSCVPLPGYT